ncbi:related to gamma-cysteine synthetase regulatory subunit [Lecanosticta acicola]|uniref:GCS light chain n=1 Tax=Lecanosticta acicola TaxID=111012 RepID=A0AAI8YUM2_9PEZI|nr:related to gamma-cysteine synthetase regulatory subunit [Lecanosticta acicola]
MKLLLTTSNAMRVGSSIRRSPTTKSNTEFIESLRANFAEHSTAHEGHVNGDSNSKRASYQTWTRRKGDTLEIPALDFANSALAEERDQYDITVKLFYLPGASREKRAAQTREALDLVLKELHVSSIDLLIVSFPGIYFDEEEDCPDKINTRGPVEAEPEPLEGQLEAWKTLETFYTEGLVRKLGIAEFGKDRLEQHLQKVQIPPSVDQINLRDCCSVPKDLMALAKSKTVELLVHNDSSNILPRGTTRELLGCGEGGAGVLADASKSGDKRKSLHGEESQNGDTSAGLRGEVQPQWVVKYTAVVRNRGVVENKGYFACAELTG